MGTIILGGRYVIENEIGAGGMAIVYKAQDTMLNRTVAVKVLRPEFKQDEEFIKRFDIEAKAAAALNHPNIVSVYDVGVYQGLHYIVMEYIEGVTLKTFIARKGQLPWRTALKISEQICSALAHAHTHKVIHRDIKPHNIMVTETGTVKVMDFGIARAASGSTMTLGSKILGSAHYLSPEQARGGFTDERSDLYSLGVCMYEMITGRVPFDADTTVAVAMQHLQKDPKPLREIVENLPASVEYIVLKAMRKELSRRYGSAALMESDIIRVLADPVAELSDENSGAFYSTKQMDPVEEDAYAQKKPEKKAHKKTNYWLFGSIGAACAVIMITVITLFSFGRQKQQVPNLLGNTLEEAQKIIADELGEDVIVTPKYQYGTEEDKDKIIEQKPDSGKQLVGIREIEVTISRGEEVKEFILDDYRGKSIDTVVQALQDMNLLVEQEEETSDDLNEMYKKNTVSYQFPTAGTTVKTGQVITLHKSLGAENVKPKVPSVRDMTVEDAKEELLSIGFANVSVRYENSDTVEKNKVIRQMPTAAVRQDVTETITLVASLGPKQDKHKLTFSLPEQPETIHVKVIRKDNGETVYSRAHVAGETVQIDVKNTDNVVYEIYLNDSFWSEKSLQS